MSFLPNGVDAMDLVTTFKLLTCYRSYLSMCILRTMYLRSILNHRHTDAAAGHLSGKLRIVHLSKTSPFGPVLPVAGALYYKCGVADQWRGAVTPGVAGHRGALAAILRPPGSTKWL
jgi:hypothetical protein